MNFLIRQSVKFYSKLIPLAKIETMNQGKCYLRLIAGETESKIDINFLFPVKNVWRQFNLSRKPSESLDILIGRIEKNLEKVIAKGIKKKDSASVVTSSCVKFYSDFNSEIPGSTICEDLFQINKPVTLKIDETILDVVFNPPWVVSVGLPKSLMAGFPVFPENFTTQFSDEKCNAFDWYTGLSVNSQGNVILDNHIDWKLVGNEFIYVPKSSDIGLKLKLKCTPGNILSQGPSIEVVSSSLIEAGPGECPFEIRHKFTANKLNGQSFRCVTYNILADLYCDSDFTRTTLHPYCPPYALHIDYRKQLVIKELLGYNADLICLQEVDGKVFKGFLQPLLGASGMDGLFYKKGKTVSEGLSCFYRRDRFSLVTDKRIFLAEALPKQACFNKIWDGIKDNKPLLDRLLDRSTVASATVLESLDNPDNLLLVGNTHLYFHPNAAHIRLLQGAMFLFWLQSIEADLLKQYPDKKISLILCGDFNSIPTYGLYQLYTSGSAPSDLRDWRSTETEVVENLSLTQDTPLASACGTPEYTNFTPEFTGCLDYIFYDKTKLSVEQVVPLPSDEDVRANVGLPSVVFPSDHLSLVADLQFIQ